MKNLSVKAIKTHVFRVGEDLNSFLSDHLKGQSLEGKILAVTSKIVSLAENRVLPKDGVTKRELVKREADFYLGVGGYDVELTIKHGILIPSAGIDESNSEHAQYILYPEHPYRSAERIWRELKERFQLKNFGVILTDSHTTPLRRGVTGISLAHWGMKPVRSLVGQQDLFGKPLKFTYVDVVDAVAVMAVLAMGEAEDSCPLAIVAGVDAEFTEADTSGEVMIPWELDLYRPMLADLVKTNGTES